jgi:hypothetical protein
MISNYLHLQPLPKPLNTGTQVVSRPTHVVLLWGIIVCILVETNAKREMTLLVLDRIDLFFQGENLRRENCG